MLNERVKKAHVDPSNTVERLIADSDLRLKGVIRDISKASFLLHWRQSSDIVPLIVGYSELFFALGADWNSRTRQLEETHHRCIVI